MRLLELDLPAHGEHTLTQPLLGLVAYGQQPWPKSQPDIPVQQIAMPVLATRHGTVAQLGFALQNAPAVTYGQQGDLHYAHDGELLFATVQCTQTDDLRQASHAIYSQIFALIEALDYQHLWRIWNYLADINGNERGLERYRQFNAGRYQAFEENQTIRFGHVPAACALGTPAGTDDLSVALLASKTGYLQIENPRQVSAYDYPQQYGPRSPTFSRAVFARTGEPNHLQNHLIISGTASIVGHASLHLGDVAAQTQEAVNNIEAVLQQANHVQQHVHYALPDLVYLVYVKQVQDLAQIQALLRARLGADTVIAYVQADICRAELLVEIEAHCLGL